MTAAAASTATIANMTEQTATRPDHTAPEAAEGQGPSEGRAIEPVIVITRGTVLEHPVVLSGDGLRSGINHFPGWVYDYGVRASVAPRRPSAVLYTAHGAHDLADLLEAMHTCEPFAEIVHLIRSHSLSAAGARQDLGRLSDEALAALERLWLEFRRGVRL